jgi:hypothetical protein
MDYSELDRITVPHVWTVPCSSFGAPGRYMHAFRLHCVAWGYYLLPFWTIHAIRMRAVRTKRYRFNGTINVHTCCHVRDVHTFMRSTGQQMRAHAYAMPCSTDVLWVQPIVLKCMEHAMKRGCVHTCMVQFTGMSYNVDDTYAHATRITYVHAVGANK